MTLDYHDATTITTDDGNAKLRTTDDKHDGPQRNAKTIATDNDQQRRTMTNNQMHTT
jgi:hypothetical protein